MKVCKSVIHLRNSYWSRFTSCSIVEYKPKPALEIISHSGTNCKHETKDIVDLNLKIFLERVFTRNTIQNIKNDPLMIEKQRSFNFANSYKIHDARFVTSINRLNNSNRTTTAKGFGPRHHAITHRPHHSSIPPFQSPNGTSIRHRL